ncbi:MAG: undecaprenyl-diphosphate phosphatase, partial [Thiohalorhabdaceae bacterium]
MDQDLGDGVETGDPGDLGLLGVLRQVTHLPHARLGLLQGLAVLPGISRSGSTVFGLLYRDFSPAEAFRLSFLLSVPAVFIA